MNKLSKKQFKKFKTVKAKLLGTGLNIVTEPTSTIILGNGGLHNGVCPSILLNLLNTFGNIQSFSSIPKKSYAIASYTSVESAQLALDTLQGYEIEKSDGDCKAILFLYFINSHQQNCKTENSNFVYPEGLQLIEDFISKEEEEDLLFHIEKDFKELSSQHFQSKLKNRQVLHYGYKFQYGNNDVDLNDPMAKEVVPEHINSVLNKVLTTDSWNVCPDQCTVNKYEPGQGIPYHVDNPKAFGKTISSLSLGSSVLFEMKHPCGSIFNILLKPRSLLSLTGESRYNWTHGIKPKKTDIIHNSLFDSEIILQRETRWSLTLRKVCEKSDLENEEKLKDYKPNLNSCNPIEIEKQHVHDVYNQIANHFASTREKPWPKVVEFLESLNQHSFVLDIGCGSGRYLNVSKKHFIFGCDRSSSLVEICQSKHPFVFISDGLMIPVKDNYFDACICIAVIHHYFSLERRLTAIREIVRVLCHGGKALIYVWAAEQVYKNKNSSYLKSKSHKSPENMKEKEIKNTDSVHESANVSLPVHKNRNCFVQQDLFVPWKSKKPTESSVHLRFYHVFKEEELVELCSLVDDCSIISSYYDNGNWAIILEKI